VTWMHQGKRNWMYRAQPIPYDWVPEGTGRSENEVLAPDNASYRVNG
jgi:hypothetical protein